MSVGGCCVVCDYGDATRRTTALHRTAAAVSVQYTLGHRTRARAAKVASFSVATSRETQLDYAEFACVACVSMPLEALMATDAEIFEELSKLITTNIPAFSNRWKLTAWWNLFVAAVIWPFNPKYLTSYITTNYPHVDWPQVDYAAGDAHWKVLAHEYVHLFDRQRLGYRFNFAYLFPQILAPLALLALFGFVNPWFLLNLLWLTALAPWPAPGREWAELRGYTMSMAVNFWRYGGIEDGTVEWIEPQFTGWPYYKMSRRSSEKMRELLRERIELIRSGKILEGPENEPFRKVNQLLQQLGEVPRG